MPAGKRFTPEAVAWLPQLPDCSKLEWLLHYRGPDSPALSEDQISQLRKAINVALAEYVGKRLTTPSITSTEQNLIIRKVAMAAKKLLQALDAPEEKRMGKWEEELLQRIEYGALGHHSFILINTQLNRVNANLRELRSYLDASVRQRLYKQQCGPIPEACLKTLKELAGLEVNKPTFSRFSDPYLFALVERLREAWTFTTGLSPLHPKLHEQGENEERSFPFAEWVQEIVLAAREHLPSELKVPEIKTGSILDICRFLKN